MKKIIDKTVYDIRGYCIENKDNLINRKLHSTIITNIGREISNIGVRGKIISQFCMDLNLIDGKDHE